MRGGQVADGEQLEIRLFGGFSVLFCERLLPGLDGARQQALLAWLLLNTDAPQPRRRIALTFWPDSPERQALTNLRRELHHLRRMLPGAGRLVEIGQKSLRWRDDAPCRLDVAGFDEALPADRGGCGDPPRRTQLEQAAALYRGPLLPDLDDEWLEPYRQAYRRRAAQALEQLASLCEQAGEDERAMAWLRRLLELEPAHEGAWSRLMALYLGRGERALALAAYRDCTHLLEEQLGARPGRAVQRIYRQLTEAADEPPPGTAGERPLIGRKGEWAELLTRWQETPRAGARAIVIGGEAGIGKSRLAEALYAKACDEDMRAARTRSYAAEGRFAFAPLGDWLRSPALEANLACLDAPWLTELARLLPELLQKHPDLPAPQPLTESWQRQRLFEALARALLVDGTPLLLLFDDLQWCDRDTLEWLHFLLRFSRRAPVLLLGTVRSEEQHDNPALCELLRHLQQQDVLHRIELGPLDPEESVALAASVKGGALDAAVGTRLFAATEGHPLFIVEAVHAGLELDEQEDGVHALAASPRVQAVIAARLAQLSEAARAVAQLAAIVGRAFDLEVLRAASDLSEEALVAALDELWLRAIIREQRGAGHSCSGYDFSHDRLREGAIETLSPARRGLLHRRVAEALSTLNEGDPGRVSARLAAHFEQGGLSDRAIACYVLASERANDVSASREAIRLANRALALLEQAPAGTARDRRELAAHNALVAALSALRGFTPPELEAVLERTRQLAEALNDSAALIPSLWGLYALHIVRGNIGPARDLAERATGLAGEDSGLLTDCHQAMGGVDLTEGRLIEATAHFATADRLYRGHRARRVPFGGADVGVFSLAWGAHAWWLQGEIERAREQVAKAEAIAAELAHPFTSIQAAAYRSIYCQLEQHVDAAESAARIVVHDCERYNVSYYHEWGVIVGGWVLTRRGEVAGGAARMRRGLEALRRQGAYLRRPYYLSLLVECCLGAGDAAEARALLDAAMTVAEQNRERWWLPELWRLRGLTEEGARARTSFSRAVSLAEEQGSRSLALRAALSLARRLSEEGSGRQGIARLETLLGTFPDRLDSHDLRAGRAFLNKC